MKNSFRQYLLVMIKVVIMVMLLVVIARQVHWQDYQVVGPDGLPTTRPGILGCLAGVHLWPFLLAVALQMLTIYFTAFRWRLLMFVQGITLDLRSVLRLSYLGEFFNNFLPGAMGGDAVKAFYVMRHTGKRGATLVSIFANRFVGLLVMVSISVMMLGGWVWFGHGETAALKQPVFAILFIATGIVVLMTIALNERLNNSRLLLGLMARFPFSRQLEVLREALHRHRKMGAMLWPVLLYSLLIVTAFIMSVMFVGMSLEVNLAWHHYFLYMPLIMIMTAVPITPGGVGVMEELFLYFFSSAGDPQKILALALLYRLALVLCGLPGVMIFFSSTKISRQEIAEGLEGMKASAYHDDSAAPADTLSSSKPS